VLEFAPSILAAADAAPVLPRLGGMARPDGVVVMSQRFWAFARTDGELAAGDMPQLPGLITRIPIVRGLGRLLLAFVPLLAGPVSHRRGERLLVLGMLAAPLPLGLLPPGAQLAAALVLCTSLVAWLMRGRTLFLHGAEHRAIAASEERRLVATWVGAARPSRYSRRCGTNFAALALGTTAAMYLWVPGAQEPAWSFPLALAALGLAMEAWHLIQAAPARAASVALAPGLLLQCLTTREPDSTETRLALRAVSSVLERELAA
jgi:uncharacterized protein YqhQ